MRGYLQTILFCVGRPHKAVLFYGSKSLLCYLTLLSALCGPQLCFGQSSGVAEYVVKATFLYDFAKFVDWPPSSMANDIAPLILCIVGADPFGGALDSTLRGQGIDHHQISVRRISKPDDLRMCQIAFISRSESKNLPTIVDNLKGASTLLVGEAQGFAEHGGEIQLYLEDNSVHFAINIDAVQRAHLAINSNVLALARIVHDDHPPKAN
jgi:hypothetical protein